METCFMPPHCVSNIQLLTTIIASSHWKTPVYSSSYMTIFIISSASSISPEYSFSTIPLLCASVVLFSNLLRDRDGSFRSLSVVSLSSFLSILLLFVSLLLEDNVNFEEAFVWSSSLRDCEVSVVTLGASCLLFDILVLFILRRFTLASIANFDKARVCARLAHDWWESSRSLSSSGSSSILPHLCDWLSDGKVLIAVVHFCLSCIVPYVTNC